MASRVPGGLQILWAVVGLLALVYIVLELYYFYRPPPLIAHLAEYGFRDLLGYVYKMLLLVLLAWVSFTLIRRGSLPRGRPLYAQASMGVLLAPLAIRLTLSVYAYTFFTAIFTLVALALAILSIARREPRAASIVSLTASIVGAYTIAYTTLHYNLTQASGDYGVDALAAFTIITPLSLAHAIAVRRHSPNWAPALAFGLLALATAGYRHIAGDILPGALEHPLASASIFTALQSQALLAGVLTLARVSPEKEGRGEG